MKSERLLIFINMTLFINCNHSQIDVFDSIEHKTNN